MDHLSPREKYAQMCKKLSCHVNAQLMKELPDTVEAITKLKKLDFSRSMLGKGDVEPLVEAILRHCSNLEVLNLSQNYLTDDAVIQICETLLVSSPLLTLLNLSNNPLSNKVGRYLLRFIESMSSLKTVEVQKTLMSDNILCLFPKPYTKHFEPFSRRLNGVAVPSTGNLNTARKSSLCIQQDLYRDEARHMQTKQQWSALKTLWRAAAVAAPTSDAYSSLNKLISVTRISLQNNGDVHNL